MFTRLALGFALVLAAAALALPGSASADYRSPANLARTASIDYAAYVVRRGPYGRTVVRRGPYYGRTVVRYRAPVPEVRSRCSAVDPIMDGRSFADGSIKRRRTTSMPPSDRQAPAAPTVKWGRCLRLFGVRTRVPNAQPVGTSGAAPLATGPYRWPIAIFQFHGL